MTLTAAQLRLYLASAGISPPSLLTADRGYKAPTAAWLEGTFLTWFRVVLAELSLTKWAAEKWDCDDFADLYACMARVCHARSPGADGFGLAVGVLWFTQATGGGHAIIIAYTADRGLVTIEPQTGKAITLKATEAQSAWLAKF